LDDENDDDETDCNDDNKTRDDVVRFNSCFPLDDPVGDVAEDEDKDEDEREEEEEEEGGEEERKASLRL